MQKAIGSLPESGQHITEQKNKHLMISSKDIRGGLAWLPGGSRQVITDASSSVHNLSKPPRDQQNLTSQHCKAVILFVWLFNNVLCFKGNDLSKKKKINTYTAQEGNASISKKNATPIKLEEMNKTQKSLVHIWLWNTNVSMRICKIIYFSHVTIQLKKDSYSQCCAQQLKPLLTTLAFPTHLTIWVLTAPLPILLPIMCWERTRRWSMCLSHCHPMWETRMEAQTWLLYPSGKCTSR